MSELEDKIRRIKNEQDDKLWIARRADLIMALTSEGYPELTENIQSDGSLVFVWVNGCTIQHTNIWSLSKNGHIVHGSLQQLLEEAFNIT